jgi:Arc/MetJ family transcription regulator
MIYMKTTVNIDDDLFKEASRLTGVKEKNTLVQMGLETLISQKRAIRLSQLGGTEKGLKPISRRFY